MRKARIDAEKQFIGLPLTRQSSSTASAATRPSNESDEYLKPSQLTGKVISEQLLMFSSIVPKASNTVEQTERSNVD
jgi:hypothetical protein